MAKTLKNVKTTLGLVYNEIAKKPIYIMRVKGIYTEGGSNPFLVDSLKENSDDAIDVVVNFTADLKNITNTSMLKVFKGARFNKSNYSHLPDKIIDLIKSDYDTFNGIYKDTGMQMPRDEKEFIDVMNQIEALPRTLELKETSIALEDFFKKVKEEERGGNLLEFIERYEFKEHILVSGPRGAGKTYTIDKHLREQGVEVEFIGCHNALESIDLLGYYIRNADGSFVWLDGALSGSFRKAKDKKVALFMDELLRMPSRELNILVAALTPDSEGYFNLRTNRITNTVDGIGEVELLRIPKENLWVVGTTNVGAYNIIMGTIAA